MTSNLAEKEMNELKGNVLISRVEYLSAELGEPGRYFPALRAKGVLFPEDCEKIRAKVTSSEKVYEMVELIHNRHSEKDGHAMDVLIEALRKQRVQAHIARELQRALARAKDGRREVKEGSSIPMPSSAISTPSADTPASSQNSIATPTSTLTTPSTSAVPSLASPHQFEMHPQHGALPPAPPRREAAQCTSAHPSVNVDPQFGVLPGAPPLHRGTFHPTQEGVSPSMREVNTGLSGVHLHSGVTSSMNTSSFSYHNGDYHSVNGQRRSSDLSCTTTSGTVYSTTSTEQSGLDYGRPQGEQVAGQGVHCNLQERLADAQSMLKKKELQMAQLKKENANLKTSLREMEDHCQELEKQHSQMCEKVRQYSLSEQKHLLESHKPGREEDEMIVLLRVQLQKKEQQIVVLQSQVEQYQQDNQQLQLSLSNTNNSARPQHLPIGTPTGRPPAIHRHSYNTPVRSPYQSGVGDAPMGGTPGSGITPMRSVRVGDNLNQHNIHLQQSWGSGPRRDSPAYSPGKEPATKGPGAVFSPGRESVGKGGVFSPGSGKRLSGDSGDTPMGESYFQSSSSSLNSSESKGSAGITLQTTPNAEHSTMV